MQVGEITAASAGDEDFFADAFGVFEEGDAAAAIASFDGAHKAGGASTQDENVKGSRQKGLTEDESCISV